jgi:hypothetical protein
MESPALWKKAEHVIEAATKEYFDELQVGIIERSLSYRIAQSLREHGLLHDEDE